MGSHQRVLVKNWVWSAIADKVFPNIQKVLLQHAVTATKTTNLVKKQLWKKDVGWFHGSTVLLGS